MDNDDGGTRRRLWIIPFPFQFCDKPKLANERQRDDNLENILKKIWIQNSIFWYSHWVFEIVQKRINTTWDNER